MLKSKTASTLFQFDVDEEADYNGFVTIYEQEVPFKIEVPEQQYPNSTPLTIKVQVQGGDQSLTQMRMELSCEEDLFFYFIHEVNEEIYQKIKEDQQITCQFIDYPAICVKSIDKAHKDPNQYVPVLQILQDGQAVVSIIQNTEYKQVELIQFKFTSVDEEDIRMSITRKYQLLRQKLQLMETKLKDINDVVKVKNPSLLLQMQRMIKQ